LGVRKFRYGLAEKEDQVGVVTGLAYTSVGGDLLHIEALKLPGKGRMKTTGKLGDVMKESIDAASSYVRSISPKIGVKPPQFDTLDIHVHVPEGATPKDGPKRGSGDGDINCICVNWHPSAQRHCHDRRGDTAW
jgi:ATP-dependent Lon protease